MEIPKIKKSFFGYSIRDLERYILEQNRKQANEIAEKKYMLEVEIEKLKQKIIMLETSSQSNNLMDNLQKNEIEDAREQAKYWENECKKWKEHYMECNSILDLRSRTMDSENMSKIGTEKYSFSWDLIGDIAKGRPTLGNKTRIEVYRLMQFTIRHALVKEFGVDITDKVFYQAGKIAGRAFFENMLIVEDDWESYVLQLSRVLKEMGIGILEIEQFDMENGEITLTVSEDLECSGLPILDYEICTYDEGFIAALIESYTGCNFHVKEIDCWCTGHRTCRFHAVVEC